MIPPKKLYITDNYFEIKSIINPVNHLIIYILKSHVPNPLHFFFSSLPLAVYNSSLHSQSD